MEWIMAEHNGVMGPSGQDRRGPAEMASGEQPGAGKQNNIKNDFVCEGLEETKK